MSQAKIVMRCQFCSHKFGIVLEWKTIPEAVRCLMLMRCPECNAGAAELQFTDEAQHCAPFKLSSWDTYWKRIQDAEDLAESYPPDYLECVRQGVEFLHKIVDRQMTQ